MVAITLGWGYFPRMRHILLFLLLSTVGCGHLLRKERPPSPVHASFIGIYNLPRVEGYAGGLSGLYFDGINGMGEWRVLALTDRGPNGEINSKSERVFNIPHYSPRLIEIAINPTQGKSRVEREISLKRPDGQPLSGLPNQFKNEIAVTRDKKVLQPDPHGLDSEAIVKASDGSFWLADEYGPSLVHFSPAGQWIKRYVPQGALIGSVTHTEELLPRHYLNRLTNRGFEALALDGHRLFAFLQSPLPQDGRFLRILEFDIKEKKVVAEYLYLMQFDKIGDAVALGDDRFLLIDQDGGGGTKGQQWLIELNLSEASNVLNVDLSAPGDKPTHPGVATRRVHLNSMGFTYSEKAEGLTMTPDGTFLIVNDNDYELPGPQPSQFMLIWNLK